MPCTSIITNEKKLKWTASKPGEFLDTKRRFGNPLINSPKRQRAAAHIMQGSHVTNKSQFPNLFTTSTWVGRRPKLASVVVSEVLCHSFKTISMASISACLVACFQQHTKIYSLMIINWRRSQRKIHHRKKKLPIDYCISAVIVFSPQFENIPNLYKKPVPYQQEGSRMNKRSDRKQ